ncbi:isopentenyl-diphosphate Delta-isomerase [Roseibium aquae]|uniref:Isopentenyl-diphosphate Delta-isomerase n=1 Tax=Roseibium aquae TaxID=1323746 RepID=A0A916WUI9_9HYPH|nr:isopentenyl-diphosphate delta-isomerase [Roseibium aquae]GGB33809.1 isopentenyl-diphosphate Delta-isomerase [Roseibium aquae]
MAQPIIIPAIADDGSLYPVEKLEAHERGLYHLAISIFVFDGDRLLIQKRASTKYHCGGLWANTCCSHPNWGEGAQASAERRLREELGISVPLAFARIETYSADVGNGLHEHEKVTMFTGSATGLELEIEPNPDEVEAVRWVAADELRAEMARTPDAFTPWFRIYLDRFPDLAF